MDFPTTDVSNDTVVNRPSVLPVATAIHLICLAAITLAMTALTHNLDDIKVLLFYFMGPILMLIGAGIFAVGEAPRPNRWIVIGLAAYFWVLMISTLFSHYSYAGWDQILWWWSAFGFFISAMAIGSSRRSGENLLRGLVVLILVVNLIGFFMYDILGNGHSGVEWLMQYLYGPQPPTEPTHFYRLLMTLSHAAADMQSTILSRDFYSAVCLFYLPLAMFLAIKYEKSRFSVWRIIGFITSLTLTTTIFLCFTRFHYPIWLLSVSLFSVAFFIIGTDRQRVWLVSLVILLFACAGVAAFFKYADLMKSLSLKYLSSQTLATIWAGAWGIFSSHPILGGGPGTFGIYFPDFRDPNYYQYGISHVTVYSHNHYLDALSETGLLGFAAFGVLLFGILRPIARGAFSRIDLHQRGRLMTGLVAAITVLCVIFVSPISRWVVGAVSMWTILGLAAGWALQQPAASIQPSLPSQRIPAYAVVALALLLLPLCATKSHRYFYSNLPYARGLSSMEPAMDAIDRGNLDQKEIQSLLEESIADLEESMLRAPHFYSPYYKLGSVFTLLSNMEREMADKARADHKEAEAGQHEAKAEDYLLRARNNYEKLAAINPHYAQLDYNLGIVYNCYAQMLLTQAEKSPDRDKLKAQSETYASMALRYYEIFYRMSNSKEAALGYGNALLAANRPADALKVFEAASDQDPKDTDLAEKFLESARKANNPAAVTKATARFKPLKPESELLKP